MTASWAELKSALEIVRGALAMMPGPGFNDVRPESLLIEDVGLDSLQFVDLTVRLERVMQIDRFPMQEWADECFERREPLTVVALARACQEILSAR